MALCLSSLITGPADELSSVVVIVNELSVEVFDILAEVSPVIADAVTVPFTCNAVDGSEVPIPTREFVTSRYNRFVSNARSVPFRVKFAFRTDPEIRPMAILRLLSYNNVSMAIHHTQPDYIAG